MKVAVIIPDRGDRPEFLEHLFKMLENQTMKPVQTVLANWIATSDKCDITERYRIAYNGIVGCDCILFMENDDYYAPNYIETMVKEWLKHDKPDLFGTAYTYYYHIGILKYIKFDHPRRASMMNTLIKPGLKIEWCEDFYPYTDAWLWKKIENRKTFVPNQIISLGIKHGIGMSGGEYHKTKLERYNNDDTFTEFLSSNVDNESLTFYLDTHEKILSTK
jgi:hypothetical protein